MSDERIIYLYKQGYSMKYIANIYYRFKNRNRKPIVLDGVKLYPEKIYTKSDCVLYVSSVIYSYIISDRTQTTSCSGRGAF